MPSVLRITGATPKPAPWLALDAEAGAGTRAGADAGTDADAGADAGAGAERTPRRALIGA
jgi:hypothetical protein